mmetsp:Transcript_13760/g.20852  ORF Transcript_13760/g.20852 Transcript_13760/m.20852 type:complete len:113 (-) Transcript_13760:1855-2193(-)
MEWYDAYIDCLQELNILLDDRNRELKGDDFIQISIDNGKKVITEHFGPQYHSYNLIFSSQYMLLVPRSFENVNGISGNAMAFLKTIYLRSPNEFNLFKRVHDDYLKKITFSL